MISKEIAWLPAQHARHLLHWRLARAHGLGGPPIDKLLAQQVGAESVGEIQTAGNTARIGPLLQRRNHVPRQRQRDRPREEE